MSDTIITIRAKAFTGDSTRSHRAAVSADGVVRVWDSVAGHYTTCHALSAATQRRIARNAKQAAK